MPLRSLSRWRRSTFPLRNHDTGQEEPTPVLLSGVFGIRRDNAMLFHVPSKLAIAWFATQREAKAAAAAIIEFDPAMESPDWDQSLCKPELKPFVRSLPGRVY